MRIVRGRSKPRGFKFCLKTKVKVSTPPFQNDVMTSLIRQFMSKRYCVNRQTNNKEGQDKTRGFITILRL